jgi:hypothetical protein
MRRSIVDEKMSRGWKPDLFLTLTRSECRNGRFVRWGKWTSRPRWTVRRYITMLREASDTYQSLRVSALQESPWRLILSHLRTRMLLGRGSWFTAFVWVSILSCGTDRSHISVAIFFRVCGYSLRSIVERAVGLGSILWMRSRTFDGQLLTSHGRWGCGAPHHSPSPNHHDCPAYDSYLSGPWCRAVWRDEKHNTSLKDLDETLPSAAFLIRVYHDFKLTMIEVNIWRAFAAIGFSYDIAETPYRLLFDEQKLRRSRAFAEPWDRDTPLESLSTRRRQVRFGWINKPG